MTDYWSTVWWKQYCAWTPLVKWLPKAFRKLGNTRDYRVLGHQSQTQGFRCNLTRIYIYIYKAFLVTLQTWNDSKSLVNLQFEVPLAQASVLIEHATELQHKTASRQWTSQYELEPKPNFKYTRWKFLFIKKTRWKFFRSVRQNCGMQIIKTEKV